MAERAWNERIPKNKGENLRRLTRVHYGLKNRNLRLTTAVKLGRVVRVSAASIQRYVNAGYSFLRFFSTVFLPTFSRSIAERKNGHDRTRGKRTDRLRSLGEGHESRSDARDLLIREKGRELCKTVQRTGSAGRKRAPHGGGAGLCRLATGNGPCAACPPRLIHSERRLNRRVTFHCSTVRLIVNVANAQDKPPRPLHIRRSGRVGYE